MSHSGRAILLAMGGGIAAYKSAVLCSRLVQAGHQVRVAMTDSAEQFVGAATMAALSGHAVARRTLDPGSFPLGPHIELADNLDLMLVVPTTANLMAKFAGGIADDLISTTYLQATCPVWLAPAMSDAMWKKPSVQRNLKQVQEDGCRIIGPESGWLSCRVQGEGRMTDPEEIFQSVERWTAETTR